MKIYSSRVDDVRQRRKEWEDRYRPLKEKNDAENKAWREADRAIMRDIEQETAAAIGPVAIDLNIHAGYGFSMSSARYRIEVEHNNQLGDSSKGAALRWSMTVELDEDGNVAKETSSWSGLQAVTPEQIEDLKESVRVIEKLNQIDWKPILDKAVPQYSDYIDKENSDELRKMDSEKPNFDKEERMAALEDAAESGAWIKMKGRPETDYYRGSSRGDYVVRIDKLTPKFATVHITVTGEDGQPVEQYQTDERIGIDKLLRYIPYPVETV